MKRKSHLCRKLFGIFLTAALLCPLLAGLGGAAAPPANVWLNGKPVTFTDAVPQNEDGRVFMPFRAIFEALGAEVEWEDATRTAIAKRGDTLVRVPIGSYEIDIFRNGEKEVLEMDRASYIDPVTGRSYVPVRFMAYAMDCLVGWDQEDQTVILIAYKDLAKEVVNKHNYSFVNDGQKLYKAVQTGNLALNGEVYQSIEAKGMAIAETKGSFSGIAAEGVGRQMSLDMKIDYSAGYETHAWALGITLEELLQQMGVKQENLYAEIEMEVRENAATGEQFMNVGKANGAASQLPTNEWISVEGGGLSAVDVTELLSVNTTLDPLEQVIEGLMLMDEPVDRETSMEDFRVRANEIAYGMSDAAFKQNGEVHVTRWQTGNISNVLSMNIGQNGKMLSCSWDRIIDNGDQSTMRHSFVDAEGNVNEIVTVTAPDQTETYIENGKYRTTDKKPVVSIF